MVGVCHMRRLCRRRVAKLATPTGGAAIECGGETVSGRYIKVSQKTKPFFALWDACHATTMALHLAGDVPQPGKTRLGKFICCEGFRINYTSTVVENVETREHCSALGCNGSREVDGNVQTVNIRAQVCGVMLSVLTLKPNVDVDNSGLVSATHCLLDCRRNFIIGKGCNTGSASGS